jgi:hypothetical protein
MAFPSTSPTGALGMNEIVGVLKEIYDGQVVQSMTYSDNPFLAMVRKDTNFGGKLYPLPIIVDSSQGRSSSFALAQSNQSAMNIKEFMLTRVSDYSIAQITHEAMLAASTDEMAFINGVKAEVDQAIQVCVNSLASALFRDGTGTIGTVSAISSGVITLSDPNSVVQFSVGQVLQAVATGTPRAALGYVIAVNRSAGKLTVSTTSGGSAGTPGSWVATDNLVIQGDLNSKVSGLSAWLQNPANVSGSDSFFGVNRSSDVTRLAGVFYDGSAQSIEEALIDASSLLAREGGKPDVCVLSFASYSALEKALGARANYVEWDGPAEIAFRGIKVNGANSVINVFPDRNCVGQTAFLLTMKTWVLASLFEAPHIFDYNDGVQMLRMASNDAAELRIGYYAQLGCNAPGHNAVVLLGA